MAKRVAEQARASSNNSGRYTLQHMRGIGVQIDALLSWHCSMEMYRRSIERQLALLAACMHAEDVALLPCNVFLLLEMRGSGGLSTPLEQIASVLAEVGYWKPAGKVQTYHPRDGYFLGRSAQKLFDDFAALDGRVRQLHAHLSSIKECWHMKPEASPQDVFERVAMGAAEDRAEIQARVDAIVELLEEPSAGRRLIVAIRRLIGSRGFIGR